MCNANTLPSVWTFHVVMLRFAAHVHVRGSESHRATLRLQVDEVNVKIPS